MTFDDVRALALQWPGVEDADSYSTPALKVGGKLLARLKEDGDTLVLLGVDFNEREMLMASDPDVYFITEHYADYPDVLVWLPSAKKQHVESLLLRRWRAVAPKGLVQQFDARS